MRSHVRFTRELFVGGRTHAEGEVAELDEQTAGRLVRGGHAEHAVDLGAVAEEITQTAVDLAGVLGEDLEGEEPGQATEANALAAAARAARRSGRAKRARG